MKQKGFTLIEILMVITIIFVIVALLLPALAAIKSQARSLVCMNKERQVGVVMQTWYKDSDFHLLRGHNGGTRWGAKLLDTYPQAMIAPKSWSQLQDCLLICPENSAPVDKQTYNYPSYTPDIGGSYQLNRDAQNYDERYYDHLQDIYQQRGKPWWGNMVERVKHPQSHILLTDNNGPRISLNKIQGGGRAWYRFDRGMAGNSQHLPDPNRHSGKVGNCLFLDGHVKSIKVNRITEAQIRYDK